MWPACSRARELPSQSATSKADCTPTATVQLPYQQRHCYAVDIRKRGARKTVKFEQAHKRFEIGCLCRYRRVRWNLAGAGVAQQLRPTKRSRRSRKCWLW